MNDQQIQQLIKDTAYMVNNTTKKENSGLYTDIKNAHGELKTGIDGVNKRLDTLNGSVAKQQDKLAQHDIINAQVTITQQQIIQSLADIKTTDLATLKKSDADNSKYITETKAVIYVFKWLVGFIGIGNIALIVKIFLL